MDFNGTLMSNEIFAALYNMIISQQVYATNLGGGVYGSLVEANRVDGTLYGDTKLYYDTDVLESKPWLNDAEAENLLQLHRPAPPKQQAIRLNIFRIVSLTVDNYLTKRAWMDEGAFGQFTSVIKGWMTETKRLYDATTYNVFEGTSRSAKGLQTISITLPTGKTEADNRLRAQQIAERLANLLDDMADPGRNYNDNGTLKSYAADQLQIVWSTAYLNKITKLDLPTIFHNESLIPELTKYKLPPKYFGTVNGSGGTTTGTNKTVRAMIEKDFGGVHCFPGDLLPNNAQYQANETYTEDPKVICKVVGKGSLPYMSAFEVGTSFYNPRSLTENHYLIWGHNTLEHLKHLPNITISSTT